LRTIDCIKLFNTIFVMTAGGPANATETVAVYAYKTAFQSFNFGAGSALGVLIALLTMGFVVLYLRLLRRSTRGGTR
jgi:multiple sugar transport system permease protein